MGIYDYAEIDVLKSDGCSEREAKKYLAKGTSIYSPKDCFQMLKDFPAVAAEVGISEEAQVSERCQKGEQMGDTHFTSYKGAPCVIEYVV